MVIGALEYKSGFGNASAARTIGSIWFPCVFTCKLLSDLLYELRYLVCSHLIHCISTEWYGVFQLKRGTPRWSNAALNAPPSIVATCRGLGTSRGYIIAKVITVRYRSYSFLIGQILNSVQCLLNKPSISPLLIEQSLNKIHSLLTNPQ